MLNGYCCDVFLFSQLRKGNFADVLVVLIVPYIYVNKVITVYDSFAVSTMSLQLFLREQLLSNC